MIRATNLVLAAAAALLLVACGGSSDDQKPSVNSMAATPAAYGRTAVWSISGLNLDKGIVFVITAGSCDSVTEVPGGTAFQRQFSCRPSALGELIGQVNAAGGDRLASLRVIIPTPVVQLSLSQGTINLELDPEKAPISVNNFLNYVNSNFYNNTIFHRVIADFVIQGGGYTPGTTNPTAKAPTQPAIALESNNGLTNLRGTLAMARTSDPNSGGSQFYIVKQDTSWLDRQYTVFGQTIEGMDVVKKLVQGDVMKTVTIDEEPPK